MSSLINCLAKVERSSKACEVVLGNTIGQGSYSSVFEGTMNGNKISAKILKTFLDVSGKMFNKEIKHLRQIYGIPHALQLLGILNCTHEDPHRGFITNLINGPNLENYIETEEKLPIDTMRSIAKDILKALSSVHETGLVHADIRPQNIVIQDKQAYLIDFGLSHKNTIKERDPRGHPDFLAPEALVRGIYSGTQKDMWAMGCTFFATMTNNHSLEYFLHNKQKYKTRHLKFAQVVKLLYKQGNYCFSFNDLLKKFEGMTEVVYSDKPHKTILEQTSKTAQTELQVIINDIIDTEITNEDLADLIKKLLRIVPEKRLSAQESLQHFLFNPKA